MRSNQLSIDSTITKERGVRVGVVIGGGRRRTRTARKEGGKDPVRHAKETDWYKTDASGDHNSSFCGDD